ncbi:MAG: hypothetical protein LH660_21370, partial [Phormidesmis sp. CAN_BIN36]|nr:hypothetical protein [Phormidesmis sp. CAN_BIN36]
EKRLQQTQFLPELTPPIVPHHNTLVSSQSHQCSHLYLQLKLTTLNFARFLLFLSSLAPKIPPKFDLLNFSLKKIAAIVLILNDKLTIFGTILDGMGV